MDGGAREKDLGTWPSRDDWQNPSKRMKIGTAFTFLVRKSDQVRKKGTFDESVAILLFDKGLGSAGKACEGDERR